MLGSGSNLNGSTSSGITSSDMPPLPQYLPLDPITLGSKKYTRSGELRRVLGVSVGNTSEDHSFGTLHHKPMAPVAPGELKNFKESVQDASRKARYREAIALNTKKRQRTDLSSERGSGVNLTKMGSQTHKTPNDNLTPRSEVKTSNSMLNKRLRTAVADVREESRSAAIGRQQMVTEKDGNSIQTLGGGSVRNEEKTRRLLAGGEGLDQKIKKKRSVGAVGNRVMTGERDVKRSALPKANADSKMRFYDTQGFRLKPLPGSSGINKSGGSSEPSTIGVRNMLASEPEGGSLHRDHIAEQKVVAKGSNRSNNQEDFPASISNTLIKNKVSRAPRTGSVSALDLSNVQSSSENFPGSSIHPMTQWVGQRPPKNSRSRRVKVVSPASRSLEVQVSSEGCQTSDLKGSSVVNNGLQLASSVETSTPKYKRPPDDISSPFGFSESEESGAGEHKIKEKGMNGNDFDVAAEKGMMSMAQMKKNKIPTDDSGDCVQRQGRTGRNLSLIRSGVPSGREKSENPPTKPVQEMRSNDKSKTKYGRPPSKKQKDRKVLTRVGKQLNIGSSDFGGESDDDHEELYKAANAARNASNIVCSGSFWNKMEPIFASISLDDASYLKQQLNIAEEVGKSLSHLFGIDNDLSGVVNNKTTQGSEGGKRSRYEDDSSKLDALGEKNDSERLDKVAPLFQRLLCALIEEDDNEESYHLSDAKNISRQCASDDSHCDSCNQIDFEPKDRDRMDSEVESKVDLHIQKSCMLDRLSCDKSTASNTFRYPNTSSSLQSTGVWQGDEEFSVSDITHTSEICSNDLDQLHPGELSIPGFPSPDDPYQLMSLDDRLLLELQSIGLYPEILVQPDLAEEDEAINQDIEKLEKALYEQNGSKKKNLDRIDRAIQKGRDMEKRKVEQVAFDQLIEIAYRRRLACRGSKNSKGAVHKVSKQVALAFLKRTLGRCKRYEEAGISCFSEPALQNIMFSPPSREKNDGKPLDCIVSGTASNTCNKALNQGEARKSGAVSIASEKYDFQRDYADRGLPDSFQGSIHSSEQASSKNGSVFIKEKKREMLVNGGVSGGVKGKRSERDRNQSKDQAKQNSASRSGRLSLDSCQNENKTKAKPKQKITAGEQNKDGPPLSGNQETNKVNQPSEFENFPLPDLSTIEEFGASVELGGPQDLSSWLNFDEDGLQDHDCMGLDIPMDDLTDLNMLM
nr:uncharacterized protein LOC112784503 isoform X3 [Arachis hypogaea]